MKYKPVAYKWLKWGACAIFMALSACATTTDIKPTARDPWEAWNRDVQSFNDGLDDYVMKPVATSYHWATPGFVDAGVTNFMNNVEDLLVIANDLLQFKMGQFGMDTGRFMINSAAGLAGTVDVASYLGLPKHSEDFDQTLGLWGIPSGPYMVFPVLGPTTPRGLVGIAGDLAANPINWVNPIVWPYTVGALRIVDQRANLLSAGKILDQASVDRYEFIRNAYLQDRIYKIHDGNPPPDEEMEREFEYEALQPAIIIPQEDKK